MKKIKLTILTLIFLISTGLIAQSEDGVEDIIKGRKGIFVYERNDMSLVKTINFIMQKLRTVRGVHDLLPYELLLIFLHHFLNYIHLDYLDY